MMLPSWRFKSPSSYCPPVTARFHEVRVARNRSVALAFSLLGEGKGWISAGAGSRGGRLRPMMLLKAVPRSSRGGVVNGAPPEVTFFALVK